MTVDVAIQARELVRIVRDDTHLSPAVRKSAGELAMLATASPDLALERLETLRQTTLASLPMDAPIVDYARCVSVEVFWRHNLDPSVKDSFATAEDYRRWVEASADASATISGHVGSGVLVPAQNSWLVPAAALDALSGGQLKVQLNFDQSPPYVIMVFSVAKMVSAGVRVRVPTGLDAVPSRLIQWYRENVADERIDGDIPRSALERIEWRS